MSRRQLFTPVFKYLNLILDFSFNRFLFRRLKEIECSKHVYLILLSKWPYINSLITVFQWSSTIVGNRILQYLFLVEVVSIYGMKMKCIFCNGRCVEHIWNCQYIRPERATGMLVKSVVTYFSNAPVFTIKFAHYLHASSSIHL